MNYLAVVAVVVAVVEALIPCPLLVMKFGCFDSIVGFLLLVQLSDQNSDL